MGCKGSGGREGAAPVGLVDGGSRQGGAHRGPDRCVTLAGAGIKPGVKGEGLLRGGCPGPRGAPRALGEGERKGKGKENPTAGRFPASLTCASASSFI